MITRAVALDIVFESLEGMAGTVKARAGDFDGSTAVRTAEVDLRVDAQATLLEMTGADALPAELRANLDGVPVANGFRSRVASLREGGADQRLLRRVMWELPIALRIAGGARMVDHPAIPEPANGRVGAAPQLVDQCSGWRSGGVMVTLLEKEAPAGHFVDLGPERTLPGPAGEWLTELPAVLPVMAMRRSRVLSVDGESVSLLHRDWYVDPDGVTRALHEWNATALIEVGADGAHFANVAVTSGQLPWPECPSAGGSGSWLNGKSPAEVEPLVTTEFLGISTCTHLNDMLRMFGDVSDLLAI